MTNFYDFNKKVEQSLNQDSESNFDRFQRENLKFFKELSQKKSKDELNYEKAL
jgi:hypothetical protein